jgi:signal transduction histidine kinase
LHKLLAYQLRNVTQPDGSVDSAALIALVQRTYDEFDRERRLNDRAAKLMEEELQAANESIRHHGEQRLIETLDGAPCAVALLDPQLTVQTVNPAMAALCAQMPPAPGERFLDFLLRAAPDTAGDVERLFQGSTIEIRIANRWFLGAARALSDGSFAVAFSEITALKQREEALGQARDAAESANKLKSQFLAVMSHELRTPLNAILGFSEVIRDCVLGIGEMPWARYREYAGSIHESGEHLLALISEILDLSKIESGSYALHLEPLDIGHMIRASLALVRPQAERGDVRVLPVEQDGNLRIEADHRALKQIVLNLLSNAVKFTSPGGEVAVTATGGEDGIVLRVRDTGIGIEPEHLKSVFEAFHQGNANVSRRYEGTGLGLSITRGLVEMHGGEILLESTPGIGTLATVRLPRRVPEARIIRQVA